MSHIDTTEPVDETRPTETPNVVLANPAVRRVLNIVVGTAAIVLPVATIIDSRSDAFDWTAWTDPATAATSFLAGLLAVAVSAPNVPKK